jgi:hypothetical protein
MFTCAFLAVFCANPEYNPAQIDYLQSRRPGYTYRDSCKVHHVIELNTPKRPQKLGDTVTLEKENGEATELRFVPYEQTMHGFILPHFYMEEEEFDRFMKLQPGRFFSSARGDAMFGLWFLIISIGSILAVYQLWLLPPKLPEKQEYQRALGRGAICTVISLGLYMLLSILIAPNLTQIEILLTKSTATLLAMAPALFVVFRTKKVLRYNYSPT